MLARAAAALARARAGEGFRCRFDRATARLHHTRLQLARRVLARDPAVDAGRVTGHRCGHGLPDGRREYRPARCRSGGRPC